MRILLYLLVIGSLFLVGCGTDSGDDGGSGQNVDSTTLYNSVAEVFVSRYEQAVGSEVKLSNKGGTFCAEDEDVDGAFDCELEAELELGADELWGYRVSVQDNDCWAARTYQPYGGYQEAIEAYQKDEVLAPSRSEAARYARRARKLRNLRGCIEPSTAPTTESEDGTQEIARMAAQGVMREFGGEERRTTCRALGKQEVSAAPDSWDFECETVLENGERYANAISCFDPPPYENFDSCTEQDGYPREPLRPVP